LTIDHDETTKLRKIETLNSIRPTALQRRAGERAGHKVVPLVRGGENSKLEKRNSIRRGGRKPKGRNDEATIRLLTTRRRLTIDL
jgi:hypothetical protein